VIKTAANAVNAEIEIKTAAKAVNAKMPSDLRTFKASVSRKHAPVAVHHLGWKESSKQADRVNHRGQINRHGKQGNQREPETIVG
jgi:hypothetical protein